MSTITLPNACVGKVLRAARNAQGLTQAQTATKAGLSSQAWVSGWETGRTPLSLEKARIYCPALGIDPERLLSIKKMGRQQLTSATTRQLIKYVMGDNSLLTPRITEVPKPADALEVEQQVRTDAIHDFRILLSSTMLTQDWGPRMWSIRQILQAIGDLPTQDLADLAEIVR